MPYDEPDPGDPLMLVGVELPLPEGGHEEACRVFAEEFARLGFREERLVSLFRNPFYAGLHRLYRVLGEEAVGTIVRESCAPWSHVRFRDRDGGAGSEGGPRVNINRPTTERGVEPLATSPEEE